MKKLFISMSGVLLSLIFLSACSSFNNKKLESEQNTPLASNTLTDSMNRSPAEYHGCEFSDQELLKNKELAKKAVEKYDEQAKAGGMPLSQAPRLTNTMISSAIKLFLINQFNFDSVMRDQAGQEVANLQENGRNSNEGTEIFTKYALYCTRLIASSENIELKKVNGTKERQGWLATIHFTDGYHGGMEDVFFKFKFETSISTMSTSASKTGKLDTLSVVTYPAFAGVERRDN